MERAGLGRSGVENLAASRPEAGVVRIIARVDESLSAQLRASPPHAMHKSPRAGAQCGIVCPGFGPQAGGLDLQRLALQISVRYRRLQNAKRNSSITLLKSRVLGGSLKSGGRNAATTCRWRVAYAWNISPDFSQ